MSSVAGPRCVVCGAKVEKAHWPNAWEKSLGMRPCCSIGCGTRFDIDVHWMPARAPDRAPADEEGRLLVAAAQRLAAGDDGRMIARDLLCGGVDPSQVRHVLQTHAAAAARNRSEAKAFSLMTFLGGTLWGTRDKREPSGLLGALGEVDAWERHFV